jgi:hypothetical protein
MSRFGLMGSWLNVMRGCVHGVCPRSGKMGVVIGTKPELNAVIEAGIERGGAIGGVTDGVMELEARVPLGFV